MGGKYYRPAGNVKFRSRTYQLFRRTPSDTCPLSFRVQVQGKRRIFSTDTPDLSLAKARAKQILESIQDGTWEERMTAIQRPRGVPTVGEWIDAFLAGDQHVRKNTGKNYASSLLTILRQARGWEKEAARDQKIDCLTESLAREWQAKRQKSESVNFIQPMDCNTSINSTLRQARSLFSKRQLAEAETHGWTIPDQLSGFLKARNVKEVSHTYVPIPEATIEAINKALPDLKKQDERLWVFHLMIRLMGLRSSEIKRARRHWLVNRAGRWYLAINRRQGEDAPKRADGEVPVPEILMEWFDAHSGDHLLPAKHKSERDQIGRDHSKWLRAFLPIEERQKTNHELRKHAGSVVVMKTGSWERAAEFLRIDLETAKAHYLSFVKPAEPLGMDDLI